MSETALRACRHCGGSGVEIDPIAVGEMVRAARVARGLGVRQLARRIGCSAAWLSDVELGRRSVSQTGEMSRALVVAL